ncbi:class I SAM-dependent methyltransferase [Halioxenophilus sp. WMMB6]|uniref:class I SAM-dependent methyltransferase n=1 Tax=Halioxenophilus sp. WMMB6 TaxID=3073815 RepID=UPI00295F3B1D|nr:class I SAM-dependent methyltransferase [Halioxenophilus sp. WMMB6]
MQNWDAERYQQHAGFVAEQGEPVLQLLAAKAGETILDLGCGDGGLSEKIAASGAQVVAVDASADMVAKARTRGLIAAVVDGTQLNYNRQFDAVFSNAALHWMLDADAVLAGVNRALKSRGRFVAEMGGHGNVATLVDALRREFELNADYGPWQNPWYFPTAEAYRLKLQQAGFNVRSITLFKRPTTLTTGLKNWLSIFCQGITDSLSSTERAQLFQQVEARVRPQLFHAGQWQADYVRLRFFAEKSH